jgi:hypothetical protein
MSICKFNTICLITSVGERNVVSRIPQGCRLYNTKLFSGKRPSQTGNFSINVNSLEQRILKLYRRFKRKEDKM